MTRLSLLLLTFAACLTLALSEITSRYKFCQRVPDDNGPILCLQPSGQTVKMLPLVKDDSLAGKQIWCTTPINPRNTIFRMAHCASRCNARKVKVDGKTVLACDDGFADAFELTPSTVGGTGTTHLDLSTRNPVDSRLSYDESEAGHELTFTAKANELHSATFLYAQSA